MLKPVARASLRSQVYDRLREGLRSGLFPPNARLVETEIAAMVRASRTPVRAALERLASEGLIAPRATGGYMLPVLTPEDIDEIFEIRLVLEPYAAGRAARELTGERLDALDRLIEAERAAAAAQDQHGFIAANAQFREILFSAVGRRLAQSLATYEDHALYVRLLTLSDPKVQAVVIAGQERLVKALRRRDETGAAAAMRAHDRAAKRSFAAALAAGEGGRPKRRKGDGKLSRR